MTTRSFYLVTKKISYLSFLLFLYLQPCLVPITASDQTHHFLVPQRFHDHPTHTQVERDAGEDQHGAAPRKPQQELPDQDRERDDTGSDPSHHNTEGLRPPVDKIPLHSHDGRGAGQTESKTCGVWRQGEWLKPNHQLS